MTIKYTLSFPEPHTHYAEVEMLISNIDVNELNLKMAVWTPGSYLIREFQKNIDFVEWSRVDSKWSIENSQWLRVNKKDKNTWTIDLRNDALHASTKQDSLNMSIKQDALHTSIKQDTLHASTKQDSLHTSTKQDTCKVSIRYKTYCNEYSVRTNFVDDSHALINGAATFLYVDGFENTNAEIEIIPFKDWKNISTSLPQKENNKWLRIAASIDEIIDSPIEIGNHTSYFFEAANVSHELAIYGESNCNFEKLIADLKKIVEVETKIFGSHPCKNYVFFIHNTENSFGGLEHLHSSVNHITRWSYDAKSYQKAISLLAHEYFHLWNVKRIRPSSLIPYNYNQENYTNLLWFFEGITSYYDDYVCYKAGITTVENYFDIVAKNLNGVLNTAGIDTQTLAEASYDTWLKYYRRNENTNNTQISYYNKGAIIAMIFDFIIMDSTHGEKCLDDVMQSLFNDYIHQPNNGVTEKSLLTTFNSISNIDFAPYFQRYIHSTDSISIETYFELIGIECKEEKTNEVYFGITYQWKDGKLIITELDKNYGAYQNGLNVNDEIVAIDGFRVIKDFTIMYKHKKINDIIDVTISRQGILKTYKITLTENKQRNITFVKAKEITEKQQSLLNKWLKKYDA